MDSVEGIDELIIPIRIIATKDENLKNDITRATNSQTAIKKDQLEALSTFQKTKMLINQHFRKQKRPYINILEYYIIDQDILKDFFLSKPS